VIPESPHATSAKAPSSKASKLYLYVLVAVVAGALLGVIKPGWAVALKPLGDAFLRAIKMLVGPIVFCTVAHGIGSVSDLKKAGKTGIFALLYFELMTTVALGIGLGVGHLVHAGRALATAGVSMPPAEVASELTRISKAAQESHGAVGHLLGIIPEGFVAAFVKGDTLQVLFVAVLSGVVLAGAKGKPWSESVTHGIHKVSEFLFALMGLIMKAAPIGAFGAMAFTVGQYGFGAVLGLLRLLLAFYVSAGLFVFLGLGTVCFLCGLSIFKLLRYLKDEIVLVLGTSSSETALPSLMRKLEALGCPASTVRLVVPTGYSFNLDGTCIYLSLAALFAAEVSGTTLSAGDEMGLLAVLLLTSKGAAAVSGGGFVTLAATLQSTGTIPLSGMGPLLGVDRFMSEARAITNLIGNAVATLVVATWQKDLDKEKLHKMLG
jgi:aerobic C4-dicarboxylate transport protein